MAIDNDTSYELTGAQIKDLAQKIRNKADDNTFVGAGTSVAGSRGLVPAPAAGDNSKFLKGDGTWQSLADNYSTTEQNTGSTWVDGKPIYKKTLNIGTLPSSASSGKNTAHNISNLDFVVKVEGAAMASDGARIPLPYADTSGAGVVGVFVNNTNIYVFAGQNRSSYSGYVTLYYTKTTD